MNIYKNIFIVLLCAVFTVSCSHDDDGNDTPALTPIGFGNVFQKDQTTTTRAVTPLQDVIGEDKTFRVWGYKTMDKDGDVYTNPQTVMDSYVVQYFSGSENSTVTNTSGWEYVGINDQDIKYWDHNATSYRYFGFTPKAALAEHVNYNYPSDHGDGYRWYDITFPADATRPEDAPFISNLWFSNDGSATTHRFGDIVTMEFMKPVTKVRIRIINMDGTEVANPADVNITELEFMPVSGVIVQQGTLKVSYAITGPATIAYYTPRVDIEGSPVGTVRMNNTDETYKNWYYVLPHVEQGTYQLVAQVGDERKVVSIPSQYMSWHPHMEYTYTFKLTSDAFQFIDVVQIGVKNWITEESSKEIYNW